LERCTVGYGDVVVLDDISSDIPQGKITAIIGPNGSGKTTLLRAVLGLIPLKGGKISVFGRELREVRNLISYVPQRFNFDKGFPITVREFLELARVASCPTGKIEEVINEVGLAPAVLGAQLGSLSGGQLQRVLIAQAILNEPQLLVLDEPATGIDMIGEATFYRILKHLNAEHGTTVLIVSHDITIVSGTVDNVLCVNRTLLCSGPPLETLSDEVLTKVFGRHASVYGHGHHHSDKGAGHDHGDDHEHHG
jgi:ABC-type Mn2+/Zn2+ transport system ATPase subunit